MVGPLLALDRPGFGLGVRIWQLDVSGRRDGFPVAILAPSDCMRDDTNQLAAEDNNKEEPSLSRLSVLVLCHALTFRSCADLWFM